MTKKKYQPSPVSGMVRATHHPRISLKDVVQIPEELNRMIASGKEPPPEMEAEAAAIISHATKQIRSLHDASGCMTAR